MLVHQVGVVKKMHAENTIVIATHNPGKFKELSKRLSPFVPTCSLNDLGITQDVEETGVTFEENAALKARHYADQTKMITLSDDGGLCIDALYGAPGVYSSRVAGKGATDEQKIAKVLELMEQVPDEKRTASFNVVLAIAFPKDGVKYYKGILSGTITREARGALVKGLPYKTIFFLPEYGKTLAELDEQGIKFTDHRDKAIAALLEDLKG